MASSWPNSPGRRAERPGLTAIVRQAQAFTKASGTAIALATSHPGEIECCVRCGRTAPPLGKSVLQPNSLTAHCLRSGQRLLCDHAETDPRVAATAVVELGVRSLVLTPIKQGDYVLGVLTVFADIPDAFTATHLAQLDIAAGDIAEILGSGRRATSAIPPRRHGDTEEDRVIWTSDHRIIGTIGKDELHKGADEFGPDGPMARSTDEPIFQSRLGVPMVDMARRYPELPPEAEQEACPTTYRFATLDAAAARPRKLAGKIIVSIVALLLLAGGAIRIYPSISRHLATPSMPIRPVQNSAVLAANAPAVSTRAVLKIDPDTVIATRTNTFAVSVAVSNAPNIASVAIEVNYDPNLMQFVDVAEGGSPGKDGQPALLAHRDDPAAGVLKISAQRPPGKDGAFLNLTFRAVEKGTGSIGIALGARDSQGQAIDALESRASITITDVK